MSPKRRLLLAILIASGGVIALAWVGWQLSNSRSYQLFGELVTRVETPDSVVALTFDDGPGLIYTDSVLSILAAEDVRATFFVVGAALAQHAEVARRIVDAGHEIVNIPLAL